MSSETVANHLIARFRSLFCSIFQRDRYERFTSPVDTLITRITRVPPLSNLVTDQPRNPMQIRDLLGTRETSSSFSLFLVLHSKPISIISFGKIFQFCTHRESSNKKEFPTFARTRPPDTQISKSVVSVLMAFNWTKVSRTIFISWERNTILRIVYFIKRLMNLKVIEEFITLIK